MTFCQLKNVSKSYGNGKNITEVLTNVNLDIKEGEFVAIVGFSGSGKTTLVSMLAGLTKPDSGEALFKDKPITGSSSERAICFQSYSLMPWLTVFGNISLAVDQTFKSWSKAKRKEHVMKYINMVGLSHAIDRRPADQRC